MTEGGDLLIGGVSMNELIGQFVEKDEEYQENLKKREEMRGENHRPYYLRGG
ncbi:MAG: hypothetical protein AAGD22_18310 [Verrucomicrobiota bacterium]